MVLSSVLYSILSSFATLYALEFHKTVIPNIIAVARLDRFFVCTLHRQRKVKDLHRRHIIKEEEMLCIAQILDDLRCAIGNIGILETADQNGDIQIPVL